MSIHSYNHTKLNMYKMLYTVLIRINAFHTKQYDNSTFELAI